LPERKDCRRKWIGSQATAQAPDWPLAFQRIFRLHGTRTRRPGRLAPILMTPPHTDSTLLATDFESFRRQESIFAALNLLLIAALFLAPVILDQHGIRSPAT